MKMNIMEFLMTYAWAIIAVLPAVGALIYFGVIHITLTKQAPSWCEQHNMTEYFSNSPV